MKFLFLSPLLLAAALPAQAVQTPTPVTPLGPESTLLTLTAEGESRRAPDLALFNAGVVTRAPNAAAAMEANARRMAEVVAALRRAGIEPRDIQTAAIGLRPLHSDREREPSPAGPREEPRITGYEARNSVHVRVRRLAEMGRTIDALVASGANEVNGPDFSLDDPAAALDEARTQAIARGRERAALYARATGLSLRRIVSIEEGGRPMPYAAAARADMAGPSPTTPVSPGELTLGVTVTMQFELAR